MGSSRSTLKLRPLGCTVMVKGAWRWDVDWRRRNPHRIVPRATIPRLPALPVAAGAPRIVGCGDVGLRVARLLRPLASLASRPARRRTACRRHLPLVADPFCARCDPLLADGGCTSAPPPRQGRNDLRTTSPAGRWRGAAACACIVYGSTTGVYGDCGARFDETAAVAPADRARRTRRCRAAPARLRAPHRHAGDDPAHPRASTRRTAGRPSARAPRARHAGARRGRRRLHQPHPRRRPGARLRGRAAATAAAHRARQRRHRAEDG